MENHLGMPGHTFVLPCGDPGKRVPALVGLFVMVPQRTDEKKAYELLDGNVISASGKHFPLPKVPFQWKPAESTTCLSEHHEVRRRHPQGLV